MLILEKPNNKKKPSNMGRIERKPINPSGKNNGS